MHSDIGRICLTALLGQFLSLLDKKKRKMKLNYKKYVVVKSNERIYSDVSVAFKNHRISLVTFPTFENHKISLVLSHLPTFLLRRC